MRLTIEVKDRSETETIIQKLSALKDVISVEKVR
jgi:(p)ppGpp synthase/HD superfamily hydrolase